MGKNKSLARKTANNKPPPRKKYKPTGITKPSRPAKPIKTAPVHQLPTIPFSPHNTILLIGEGDLSFASSLVAHHACVDVTACVLEPSLEELVVKYPHVGDNIAILEEGGGRIRYAVDAMKRGPLWREVKGRCERVIFNFPHVGGKSKDVNRQVRYNQELLVSFFKLAQEALRPGAGSSIIVTLFESEPYTLWNVRDLARHSGLQVECSFRFQAGAYPGYRHARTLGVVRGKDGEEGGGWKGEERSARSYVFVRKGDVAEGLGVKQKRRKGGESSDDEDENNEWSRGGASEGGGASEEVDESEGEGTEEVWDGINEEELGKGP